MTMALFTYRQEYMDALHHSMPLAINLF